MTFSLAGFSFAHAGASSNKDQRCLTTPLLIIVLILAKPRGKNNSGRLYAKSKKVNGGRPSTLGTANEFESLAVGSGLV